MLVVEGLRKRFGQVQALDGVGFVVQPGQIFGFLGSNGAGKTTTMRIILGFLRPDEGTVTWRGQPAETWPRRTWGYMPEERGLYLRMPVLEQLVFYAALYGVPRREARDAARRWLSRFRIAEYADRRAETLSKGNQQKVQYIATILHEPDVLIMDEPFSGLDPVNAAQLREALLEMRDAGRTIVFSTHQLATAEALCDAVAIIDHGRLAIAGPIGEVRRSTGHVVVRVAVEGDGDSSWLQRVDGVTVTQRRPDFTELRMAAGRDPQDVLRAAMAQGKDVLRFEVADPSLEEVFVTRVGALQAEETTLAAASPGPAR